MGFDFHKNIIKKFFMTKKKDVGFIIQFDDKEYSKEETEFLWEKFFLLLAKIQNIKIDPKIVKNATKTIVLEVFKTPKYIQTSSNIDQKRY